jgi:hypothetical protein
MTNCPPEIARILLEMIGWGLLRIRALGWSGQADRCTVEADHLHNLPHLLADYSPQRLLYYWDVERVGFLETVQPEHLDAFETFWQQLEPHVEATRRTIAHT